MYKCHNHHHKSRLYEGNWADIAQIWQMFSKTKRLLAWRVQKFPNLFYAAFQIFVLCFLATAFLHFDVKSTKYLRALRTDHFHSFELDRIYAQKVFLATYQSARTSTNTFTSLESFIDDHDGPDRAVVKYDVSFSEQEAFGNYFFWDFEPKTDVELVAIKSKTHNLALTPNISSKSI